MEVNFWVFLELRNRVPMEGLEELGYVGFLEYGDRVLCFFVVALACVAEFVVVEYFSG